MSSIQVSIDTDDIIDEIDTSDLLREINNRCFNRKEIEIFCQKYLKIKPDISAKTMSLIDTSKAEYFNDNFDKITIEELINIVEK
jgi:hypothetical protein